MLKKYLVMISLIITQVSFIYPNSRIIISGQSSIIISSQDNNTTVIASNIETIAGGQFINGSEQDHKLSNGFEAELPTEFTLEKAYPNPFNPTTTIRYSIPTPTPVDVAIYDMTGRLVSDHKIRENAPGSYEFTWQGNDSHGQQISTGMYLVTMRAGEHFQKQKVTYLK